MSSAYCATLDVWLSDLLGRKAYVVRPAKEGQDLRGLVEGVLSSEDTFATLKLPSHDVLASIAAQSAGFVHVETAVSFSRKRTLEVNFGQRPVRFATSCDMDDVVAIAQTSFRLSRFHMDPLIGEAQANRIKASWAKGYFLGKRGDAMVVAEWEGAVSGFMQLLRDANGGLIIDLIAVSSKVARRGLGRAMIASILEGETSYVNVGTQVCNRASVNLYESMGFTLSGAQHVLHYHPPGRLKKYVASMNK